LTLELLNPHVLAPKLALNPLLKLEDNCRGSGYRRGQLQVR